MKPILLTRGSGMDDDQFELILLEFNGELGRHIKTHGKHLMKYATEDNRITVIGSRAYMNLETMDYVARELGFNSWEVELI